VKFMVAFEKVRMTLKRTMEMRRIK